VPVSASQISVPGSAMTLESSQALEGGAMLLRYRIQNADVQAATGR
jgi:hypothetical protein